MVQGSGSMVEEEGAVVTTSVLPSGSRVRLMISGYASVDGLGIKLGGWFRVQGSGFRVQGSGFRNQGSGFRVQG